MTAQGQTHAGGFVQGDAPDSQQVRLAVQDGYRRLLARAMETEMRLALKERADREAIEVFAANLRELLMAPPLGGKRTLALDPGFRTGAKLVCLDRQGQLLYGRPYGFQLRLQGHQLRSCDLHRSTQVLQGLGCRSFQRFEGFPPAPKQRRMGQSLQSVVTQKDEIRERLRAASSSTPMTTTPTAAS